MVEISHFLNIAFDFKRKSHNRFSICFSTAEYANNFVTQIWNIRHIIFHKEIWFASIPHYKVTKKVILVGVDDVDIDSSILTDNMRPPIDCTSHWEPPIKIERLKKRIQVEKK